MAIGYGEFWRFYTYAFVHAGLGLIRNKLFFQEYLYNELSILVYILKALLS